MTRYDQRFAWGGFGAVGTEGICTDQALLQGYAHQPGLTGGVQAHAWNPVVSGIKANSALVIALMMHVGALGLHALKAASVTQQGRDHARLYCRHHGSAIAPA